MISVVIFLKITNFNLHDLVNLSIYLASSIFLIFACFGLITIPLVFFYGRVGKILDTAAKLVVIVAGSNNIYKNHVGGSDSNDDKDKDKDKDKTNEDNKDNETKKQMKIQMIIQQLSNHVFLIINHFKLNRNIQITQSFSLFSFILSQLNLNVDDTASSLTQISYGFFFLLSLVALICFINVLGFMITYILIQKGNYEQKYPKLINLLIIIKQVL